MSAAAAVAPKLRGEEKAAIALITLGEEASAELLKQLPEEEVQSVTRAVSRLKAVSPEEADFVLELLQQEVSSNAGRGGTDYAGKLLATAFGREAARKMLDRIPSQASDAAALEPLRKADPQRLAQLLQKEHPQTMAIVLSRMKPVQAAELLRYIRSSSRGDVVMRMATMDQVSPEVVQRILSAIAQRLKSFGELSGESSGGVRAVAEILNHLDSVANGEILQDIENRDVNLVETIRHFMFVFEDLLLLDANSMKEVVAKVDRKILTVALKGTSDKLKEHFFKCMSQRGAEMLKEDIEAMGPVRIKDVESAQQKIIALVRQLEAQGVVSLKGGEGNQYVV